MDAGAKRREEAAALKAKAAAQESRDRRIKIIGGAAVAIVAIGIVAAGVIGAQSAKPQADPSNPSPKGVIADTYGWPAKPIDDAKSTLTIYEDPQCPYCGQFEAAYGDTVVELAEAGTVNVVYQMASFLDKNLPQSNKSSRRAIAALGCAIDQNAGTEYHRLIFASQPAAEGTGWTDDEFLQLGAAAGLADAELTAFETCVNNGTYLGWADNAQQFFDDEGIPGTPYIALDGEQVPDSALASVEAFRSYIEQNKK